MVADDKPASSLGFLGSFRALGAGVLSSIEDRVKLFSLELQEEKLRLIQTLVWMSAALFACMLAVTFASLSLVYFFWESARLTVLGGLAVFYIGATIALMLALRRFLARQPKPFAATLQEIGSDRACIRTPN